MVVDTMHVTKMNGHLTQTHTKRHKNSNQLVGQPKYKSDTKYLPLTGTRRSTHKLKEIMNCFTQ